MESGGRICLAGLIALVTGAGSGVGRAITLALAREGANLCLVGRNKAHLEETASEARAFSQVTCFQVDLSREQEYRSLVHYLKEAGKLDILIHSAGVIFQALLECSRMGDFDTQYTTNLRAPYRLTQCLLPLLKNARGQVVFVNSSVALSAKRPEIGQYAATKQGLKAIADSLREEVNLSGIRVLSIYLGRTATPMQEALHRQEGRDYHPEALIQPEDVAALTVFALNLPRTIEVTDIAIRPMQKSA